MELVYKSGAFFDFGEVLVPEKLFLYIKVLVP